MKKTFLFNSIICFVITTSVVIAQKAETPDYRYDVGAKINEMTITQGGTLVVASNDGLVGIKPGEDDLIFNFTEYGRVKPEELMFIPNSPYVMVGQTGFGGISSKKAVIDYMSGKVLFTTQDNGWKTVNTCTVMMPQNKLVVSGQRTSKEKYANAVAVYDLNTGKRESYIILKSSEIVSGRPLLLKSGLIIPTSKSLIKVNLESGNIEWTTKTDDIKFMIADETETEIYAQEINSSGKKTRIHKIAPDGSLLWDNPYKMKGIISNFEILPQGLAVVTNVDNSGESGIMKIAAGRSESKIAFLDASNGQDLWEKAPKTKGFVQHFYIMEDGILFGIFEGGINKISFEGKTLFKKPLKTGPNILTMAHTDQGLIYISSEQANIVNLETGEQVWKKPLKYKKTDAVSSTFDKKNSRYLISADEKLYAIDAKTGESSVLRESKFSGKETPTGIEMREKGILLTSSQNMMLVDWEIETDWHEYYRAPGKSTFGIILAATAAIAATAAAASSYANANQHRNTLGGYTSTGEDYNDMGDAMVMAAGASIQEMLKRFKATSATKDARFVLTKFDDGIGLVKINKDTGANEKEIVLKNKKPEYQVDEFGGFLYYKADGDSIFVYDLKK
ncbi:MAG: PQQ-binding-like beta-propeller repeat protein [Flavobacteriaceae bacterium]